MFHEIHEDSRHARRSNNFPFQHISTCVKFSVGSEDIGNKFNSRVTVKCVRGQTKLTHEIFARSKRSLHSLATVFL